MTVHERHRLNGGVVEYKSLRDGRKWRALPDVLSAAEGMKGICLVTLIQQELQTRRRYEARMVLEKSAFAQGFRHAWKDVEFLRIERIAILLIAIVSRAAHKGQAVRWLCDEDNMWGTQNQKADMQMLLSALGRQGLHQIPGELTFAHYNSGGHHNLIAEELVAIADLAVGGVSDAHGLVLAQGYGQSLVYPSPVRDQQSSKVEIISKWFWNTSPAPLHRVAIVVEEGCSGFITPRTL